MSGKSSGPSQASDLDAIYRFRDQVRAVMEVPLEPEKVAEIRAYIQRNAQAVRMWSGPYTNGTFPVDTRPARPVSLRGLHPGDDCPRCRSKLKALLADPYCPNDCDRPEAETNAVPKPVAVEKTQPVCLCPTYVYENRNGAWRCADCYKSPAAP